MKSCSLCTQTKPLTEFKLQKNGKYHSWCNDCSKEYSRNLARRPDQQAKRKAWYEANKDKVAVQAKTRWDTNKDQYEPARQKWAQENRDSTLAYFKDKGTEFRSWVDSLKDGKPCVDCSRFFPPYVMEYDHVKGVKRHNIGKMTNHKRERVLAEIAKCDLVCCACHRVRTHQRRPATTDARLIRFRDFINLIKSTPCKDCGGSFPPVAMDFDHVQGNKVKSITDMFSYSKERVLAEIKKCDVVCANCHRVRTIKRLEGTVCGS